MTRARKSSSVFLLFPVLLLLSGVGGCRALYSDAGFIDPSKVWKSPEPTYSPINPIYESVGVVDPAEEVLPNATPPTAEDLMILEKDYVIGPTDVVDISILDLFVMGQEYVARREISETGLIRLPSIPHRIKASGYTREELRLVIAEHYASQGILPDPTVAVTIVAPRQRVFSILGAVQRPAAYNIFRNDMRLLEGLAQAGDIVQGGIKYIYVFRQKPLSPEAVELELPPEEQVTPQTLPVRDEELPPLDEEAAEREKALREFEKALEEFAPDSEGPEQPVPSMIPLITQIRRGALVSPTPPEKRKPSKPGKKVTKWVFRDGKFVQVVVEEPSDQEESTSQQAPAVREGSTEEPATRKVELVESERAEPTEPTEPTTLPTQPATPDTEPQIALPVPEGEDPFGWRKAARLDQSRVIVINLKALKNGDDRMNILIRDKDTIMVPSLEWGEFYIAGEVLRPGVYTLTGRNITIKQAVAAAGNLAPLAWPKNALIVRRIGGNQETIKHLDLEAIMRGEEPDFYLKPDDLIAVGSHPITAPMAVVRNAFRLTYGFGFIYDRNFADPVFGAINSKRFNRW